ncbi:hypothetical protein [Amycolatopsis rubida]|uniref:hypothetical protein n=1 Tax=Amycolatopsis rubida TaxID=112413 RepID=UPI001FCAD57C|nr:hypothetical protein [Amycolatopsis rubida]
MLVKTGVVAVDPALSDLAGWYLYLWGPWFIAGGLAFAGAAHRCTSGTAMSSAR